MTLRRLFYVLFLIVICSFHDIQLAKASTPFLRMKRIQAALSLLNRSENSLPTRPLCFSQHLTSVSHSAHVEKPFVLQHFLIPHLWSHLFRGSPKLRISLSGVLHPGHRFRRYFLQAPQ